MFSKLHLQRVVFHSPLQVHNPSHNLLLGRFRWKSGPWVLLDRCHWCHDKSSSKRQYLHNLPDWKICVGNIGTWVTAVTSGAVSGVKLSVACDALVTLCLWSGGRHRSSFWHDDWWGQDSYCRACCCDWTATRRRHTTMPNGKSRQKPLTRRRVYQMTMRMFQDRSSELTLRVYERLWLSRQ